MLISGVTAIPSHFRCSCPVFSSFIDIHTLLYYKGRNIISSRKDRKWSCRHLIQWYHFIQILSLKKLALNADNRKPPLSVCDLGIRTFGWTMIGIFWCLVICPYILGFWEQEKVDFHRCDLFSRSKALDKEHMSLCSFLFFHTLMIISEFWCIFW